MPRYTKADVSFHSDQGPAIPAVNVKVRCDHWRIRRELERLEADPVAGKPTADQLEDLIDQHGETAWEVAISSGWLALQAHAEEVFDSEDVKVYSQGRSSGWAVVHGIPRFDSWDAVMLTRWQLFEQRAREEADAVPYEIARFLYEEHWVPRFYRTATP